MIFDMENWFLGIANGKLLIKNTGIVPHLLTADELTSALPHFRFRDSIDVSDLLKVGTYKQKPIQLLSLEDASMNVHSDFSFTPAKPYLKKNDCVDHFPVLRAMHLANWDRHTRFCGACGDSMRLSEEEQFSKVCGNGHTEYLTYSQAVVVMIQRENRELLLVRKPEYPSWLFTHVAGFVDPGENFQEAVVREVEEEVGVQISNIRYVGDQSWPFTRSHMIAFSADYHSGNLRPDGNEIVEARWFSREQVRTIIEKEKPSFSLSHTMMEEFVHRTTPGFNRFFSVWRSHRALAIAASATAIGLAGYCAFKK